MIKKILAVIGILVALCAIGTLSGHSTPEHPSSAYLKWTVDLHEGEYVEWCDTYDQMVYGCAGYISNSIHRIRILANYVNCTDWVAEMRFNWQDEWVEMDSGSNCYYPGNLVRYEGQYTPWMNLIDPSTMRLQAFWDTDWPSVGYQKYLMPVHYFVPINELCNGLECDPF